LLPEHQMNQPLVALDIGSTKVACAIGLPREPGPGFELLGTSLIPYQTLSDAWLGDPLTVGRTIEQALEAAAVSGDFHRALVAFSHPLLVSEHVTASVTLGDEPIAVRERDLERLAARALDHVLSVDREPLVIERLSCAGNGFESVREPLGLTATRLTGAFHIVTMPTAARRALVQAVEFAGLDVAQLTLSLQAVTAAGSSAGSPARCLVVDVGGVNTDVGLFVDGQLHALQTVPWGGLTLAMEVAKASRVTVEHAVTLSLEGRASRKPEIRQLLEDALPRLQSAIHRLLEGQPLPDTALVCGRGALIDGMVEWLEEVTEITTSVTRSPQTHTMTDLARQIGVSACLGLLEAATSRTDGFDTRSARLVDRLIDRTRTLLTEYF